MSILKLQAEKAEKREQSEREFEAAKQELFDYLADVVPKTVSMDLLWNAGSQLYAEHMAYTCCSLKLTSDCQEFVTLDLTEKSPESIKQTVVEYLKKLERMKNVCDL